MPETNRRDLITLLLACLAGLTVGGAAAAVAPVEDDDLPVFENFTVWGICEGDDIRGTKSVKITFSPTGGPTTIEWLHNNWTFTSIGDERATRDLYGAIFGTGS